MDYFLPYSVKSRLLRFALAKTGFLDTDALDLDKLNFSIGRNTNAEFRNVGLRLEKITALLQLPPSIRLLAARAVLVRVTIASDLSITAEIDGVDVRAIMEEPDVQKKDERHPESLRTPQHRKTARRLRPISAHDPGGRVRYDDEERGVPTARDLAKSFLDEEPAEDRQELAANLISQSRAIDESTFSDTSSEELGTGNGLGLPAFLTGIIQGIMDRLQVRIRDVNIRCDTVSRPKGGSSTSFDTPVGIALRVATIKVDPVTPRDAKPGNHAPPSSAYVGRRHILIEGIDLDMLCEPTSPMRSSSPRTPTSTLSHIHEQSLSEAATVHEPSLEASQATLRSINPGESAEFPGYAPATPPQQQPTPTFQSPAGSTGSIGSTAKGRFADADEEHDNVSPTGVDESDIQAGEDSHSYTSRRSQSSSDLDQALYATLEESQILYASIADFQSSHGSGSSSLPDDVELPFANTITPTGENPPSTQPSTSDREKYRSQLRGRNEGHGQETSSPTSPQSPREVDDIMTQSVVMGESMYLSATSNEIASSVRDVEQVEPSNTANDYFPPSPDHRRAPGYFPEDSFTEAMSRSTPTVRSMRKESGEADDRASTPKFADPPSPVFVETGMGTGISRDPEIGQVQRRLLAVNNISIWLPNSDQAAVHEGDISSSTTSETPLQSSMSASMFSPDMPGTFSHYADMGASKRLQASFMPEQTTASGSGIITSSTRNDLEIDISEVHLQADAQTLQALHQAVALAKSDISNTDEAVSRENAGPQVKQSLSPQVSLRLKIVRVALLERLPVVSVHTESEPTSAEKDQSLTLICLNARDVTLGLTSHSSTPDITFGIRRLTAGSGKKDFLSFMRSSYSQHDRSPDILVKVQRSKFTLQNRPIIDVRAWLRPIQVDIDLPAFDEALESFGGLSGVMEMSASMLSGGTEPAAMPSSPPRRGVRFQEDLRTLEHPDSSPELKLNITLQGANISVSSPTCTLELQSSAVKLSIRSDYIVAVVGSIKLSERVAAGQPSASRFVIQLKDLKLEYLPAPDDKDLERLLSLITPSKDKYENDDDILLDTLLRQRRKGAVLRLKLGSVRIDIKCWSFIADIQTLGDDLTKLSAVTKYLPEDDRPGLLILPRISDAHVRVPVSDNFGILEISLKEVLVAQIGLPALVAVSIGSIRAGPLGGIDIIHELRPAEQLPMVMMRMIGDEAEPTTKIKLFNLCVEYSVDTLVALTGSDTALETEKIVDDLATSILNVAALDLGPPLSPPSRSSEGPPRPVKKVALDILLHDCAIGLKPRDSNAKGILVLSDTKLSTVIPPDDRFAATLELRKASLHIIDQEPEQPRTIESVPRSTLGIDRLSSHLASLGFVGVSSIMSAKATVCITEDKAAKERFVDVEVRDELFVLETCADSTQTLISILNGLAPPAPPSSTPQFRTEVMSVEDMMASFSGDAFERPSAPPSTLFDVDEEPPLSDMDSLLQGSALTDSVYFPDGLGRSEEHDWSSEGASVPSLLDEDDGFEFMDTPRRKRFNDEALETGLKEQSLQQDCDRTKSLSSICIRGAIPSRDQSKATGTVLGAAHRFATPATPFPANKMACQEELLPLQVRVRDVHIIWNLYDGYDWVKTRTTIAEAVEEVEQKLERRKQRRRRSTEPEEEEDSVIGDCLFNSIYIGVPNNRDAGDLRRQISRGIDDMASESESYATSGTSRPTQYSGSRQTRPSPRSKKILRLMRSKAHKIAFELKGVSVDFSIRQPGSGEVQSSVDVRLRDFEIFDNVPTSTWRKFLTYHHDEDNMREMMKPMIHLEVLNIRPVPDLAATEINLRVSILPLRLHVDQDALDFITRFFEFKPDSSTTLPVADPPFIQRIEVNTVHLCLDYKPKKVDYAGIRSGHTGEFKNFVILDAANIKLKHAIVYGIKGFDTLHPTLSDIWTPDVIRNQLPRVLAGLGPLRPFVSLGAGVRDVVAIPVREYRKDGRLFRSVQKGAFHFAKTTTAELARLGAKIATGTHAALSGFEETLVGTQPRVEEGEDYEERRLVSNYADQPLGVLQGLRSARRHFERDLLTAKDAIIAVQGEMIDAGSAAGVARAVAKYGPTIVLRPVIGASRAVGQTFMGVTNQVDSTNVRRNEDKYKPR